MNKSIFFTCFLLASILNFAQSDNESIEATLNEVATAISKLHISNNPESVLKHFDKSYVETEHRLYIDNNVQIIEEPFSEFENMITGYATTAGMRVDYRVTDFLKTVSKNDWGLTIAECEFEVYKEGKLEYTAKEIQTISFVKKNGAWMLRLNQTTKFISEVFKGECTCELFSSKKDNYIAKLFYPAGSEISEQFLNFNVQDLANNIQSIEVNNNYYNWNKVSFKVDEVIQSNKSTTSIGKAKDTEELLLFLLKDVANEHCTSVKLIEDL